MELSEIIKQVKQPKITDEMIRMFILAGESQDFYTYIQQQNQLKNLSEIDRDAERELHSIKQVGFNQKDQFMHMGTIEDIDYCFSRLYVNCDKKDLMRLAKVFTEKCTDKEIPIYFKYSSDRSKRADQFVVYSNLLNLTDYVEILRSIASENPDIIQRCGKPPILTGTLDEWIGIGDEPLMTGESYTGIRAEIIEDAIKECLLGTEDFEESYDWDKIDYDLIRQTIEEKLGKRGLSIENFAFNNDNLALYNATQQEREEYDLGRKQEKMKSRLELSDEKQIIQNQKKKKNAYRKLKILEQIGFLPEELKQGTDAINSRYGFLSDIMPQQNKIGQLIENYDLSFSTGQVYEENGKIILLPSRTELTDEQKQELGEQILKDVTEYYRNYFEKEKSIIGDTINRYNQLVQESTNVDNDKKRIQKEDLYSKIKFLANSSEFFEKFGVSQEEAETLQSQALSCIENNTERVNQQELDRKGHESSLDLLAAVLMNTGIKDVEELKKFYKDNYLTWEKDYQISDEELEQIAMEISSGDTEQEGQTKKFTEQKIGRATINTPTKKKDEAMKQVSQEIQMVNDKVAKKEGEEL